MKKLLVLSVVLVSLIMGCTEEEPIINPTDNVDDKWAIELVDSIPGSEVGIFNKLVFDVDSGIHIAYVVSGDNYSLKYAYKPYGGNWTTTDVENSIDDDIIDIAVDNQKNVFITYSGYNLEDNNSTIMYIAEKSINGTFNKVKVNVLGDHSYQARYPAIYADNNNTIHMSFERANYGMRYTSYRFQGSFTAVETLDDNVSSSSSDIVIDNQGNKHIIHFNGDKIYHSDFAPSDTAWTVTHIATGNVSCQSYEGISLAIDQFNNLHASYRYDGYMDNNVHYLYKTVGSSTWTEEGIGNSDGSSRYDRAIACDTLGNPHVLYDEDYGLKMASKNGTWSHEAILGNTDYRCDRNYDIEITDKNRAHVSFHCRTTGVLLYATKILK